MAMTDMNVDVTVDKPIESRRRVNNRGERGKPAYTIVDVSGFPEDAQEIVDDANAGGNEYGLRVVEQAVNGGAYSNTYGFYHTIPEDVAKWEETKADFGISDAPVVDEAAAAQQAQAEADAAAEEQRKKEEAELDAVTASSKTKK